MHDCLFDSSLANHKLSYISKCISVTYELDSVHKKIDVSIEADVLPFYMIRQAQLDRTVGRPKYKTTELN